MAFYFHIAAVHVDSHFMVFGVGQFGLVFLRKNAGQAA